ncbi:restriction endonuclease subunit S [Desemzia incerta]|uniref:restriction endonuclease subunit S n=1 Tax=Desemzia incerta TaxID=82801 RepID=UPI00166135C4|nr:restriction endonuclease subunit S [Desemzia incerta]
MSKKKVPELRFKGFTEDWEQRKLTDVANYRNGKAHEQDIDKEGQYIVVNSKFVSTNGLVKKYSNVLIEPLQAGEIAFVLSDVPNGKAIARTFLINENNKYSLNQRIAGITPHTKADSYFLSILMNRNNYFLKYDNGVGQTNLSKHEVENFTEHYPVYEEQVKIGSFFKQVDDTIALHQYKLEKLKQLKEGYLQVMFPQNGETLPRLRFANFSADWEQHKFKDFLKVKSGRDYKHLGLGKIPVYGTGGYMLSVDDKLSDQDAIGIGRKGTIDKPQYLIAPFWTVDTLFFMTPQSNFDLFFLYSLTQKINWKKLDESTGVPSLSKSVIENVQQNIPSHQEQIKIGELFKQLDNTISLQQEKIINLQNIKKYYLQKLFV